MPDGVGYHCRAEREDAERADAEKKARYSALIEELEAMAVAINEIKLRIEVIGAENQDIGGINEACRGWCQALEDAEADHATNGAIFLLQDSAGIEDPNLAMTEWRKEFNHQQAERHF